MTRVAGERLAVYGSLAPGRPNHHLLSGLAGRWWTGHVHGELRAEGWGSELGFPGLVLLEHGPAVRVHVLESPELVRHWDRLDAFEGSGYRRVRVPVHRPGMEPVPCDIYVLAGTVARADRASG